MGASYVRWAVVAALALAAGPEAAAAAEPPETVSGPSASHWLVELESPPVADGTSSVVLGAERRRFHAGARAAGIRYRQRYAYRTLFNGVSVDASDAAAGEIRNLDGVAAVHPSQPISLDERTEAFDPQLAFALTMTGADVAQSRLGYTGRGVRVAIIDSGVDYDHPDLGGCFGPGCRVAAGHDFVGDDFDEDEADPTWQPVPHPDPFPDDCVGHGTHVAGIVGANGGVRGVAPEATLAAYRVFGCHGATSTDVLLAAMERAYRDGADVVNMSITENLNAWPQSPAANAASRLVRNGVVVVAGAGNSHLDGLHATGAPGVGAGVLAAASVDNTRQYAPAVAISPDDRPVLYSGGNGSAPVPSGGTVPIARTGTPTTPDDACAPPAAGSLDGKVALVRRGTCSFLVKATNVAAAGAAGLVVYNDAGPAIGNPGVPGIAIPVIYISQQDGELIHARLDQGPVSMTWGVVAALPNATAGQLSFFSSDGLAADLSLKPDIAAPGGFIRSTWPLEQGRYASVSGTSMASPHVAGAAALYLQAHPGAAPRDVGAALQNSADPVGWSLAPAGDVALEPVARQGAGLVDVDDAILATTVVRPATLSLGDGDAGATRELEIDNRRSRPVTYALSKTDAVALAGRDVLTEHGETGPANVAFTRSRRTVQSVTVPARGRARVSVTITPDPGLSEGAVYGGYLVLAPDDGGPPLRVTYAGYKGDYQAVPATTPTSRGFPWLARQTGVTTDARGQIHPEYAKQDAGAAFTLAPVTFGPRTGADVPFVLVHMNHFARRIRLEVFAPGRKRSLGVALERDYVPRNAVENLLAQPSALVTALPFDGSVRRGNGRARLPDGEYRLVMTVERALATRATPEETWTSPAFRIARTG